MAILRHGFFDYGYHTPRMPPCSYQRVASVMWVWLAEHSLSWLSFLIRDALPAKRLRRGGGYRAAGVARCQYTAMFGPTKQRKKRKGRADGMRSKGRLKARMCKPSAARRRKRSCAAGMKSRTAPHSFGCVRPL